MNTIEKETVRTINGNGQPIVRPLPKIVILDSFINDVALEHIYENTGLIVRKGHWNYEVLNLNSSNQITALLLTYNFKTQYHDNGSDKNTLFLKNCNNEGFKVDSICFECVGENHIHLGGLKPGDRLSV